MKVRIKKVHFWQLEQMPYLELVVEDGDYSDVVLRLEDDNKMNRKLANKVKKCLEENINLINRC